MPRYSDADLRANMDFTIEDPYGFEIEELSFKVRNNVVVTDCYPEEELYSNVMLQEYIPRYCAVFSIYIPTSLFPTEDDRNLKKSYHHTVVGNGSMVAPTVVLTAEHTVTPQKSIKSTDCKLWKAFAVFFHKFDKHGVFEHYEDQRRWEVKTKRWVIELDINPLVPKNTSTISISKAAWYKDYTFLKFNGDQILKKNFLIPVRDIVSSPVFSSKKKSAPESSSEGTTEESSSSDYTVMCLASDFFGENVQFPQNSVTAQDIEYYLEALECDVQQHEMSKKIILGTLLNGNETELAMIDSLKLRGNSGCAEIRSITAERIWDKYEECGISYMNIVSTGQGLSFSLHVGDIDFAKDYLQHVYPMIQDAGLTNNQQKMLDTYFEGFPSLQQQYQRLKNQASNQAIKDAPQVARGKDRCCLIL